MNSCLNRDRSASVGAKSLKHDVQIIPKRFSPTRPRFWLAWLAVLSSIAGAGADPAIATDSIPTRLKISAGTFFGSKLVLELHDGGDLTLYSELHQDRAKASSL